MPIVSSGHTPSGSTVSSGTTLTISPGQTSNDVEVLSGGTLIVLAGGVATNTVVNGGTATIEGSATNTIVNSGLEVVSSGGASIDATVNSGASQDIDGGIASGTVISSGGAQDVNGGTAYNDDILPGGAVYDGGSLVFTENAGATRVISVQISNLDAGSVIQQIGPGTLDLTSVADGFTGQVDIIGGVLELSNPDAIGSATIQFLGNAGTLTIDGGLPMANAIFGLVSGTAIDLPDLAYTSDGSVTTAGNTVTVTEGGVSETLTIAGASGDGPFTVAPDQGSGTLLTDDVTTQVVSAGATLTISAGQTSAFVQVLSGGTLNILAGGTAVSTINFGTENLQGGLDSNGIVEFGGVQIVSDGGDAASTIVSAGGQQIVSSGGIVSGAVVAGGATIYTGGVISDSEFLNGLDRLVISGGQAIDTQLPDGSLSVAGSSSIITNASGLVESSLAIGSATGTTVGIFGYISVSAGGVAIDTVLLGEPTNFGVLAAQEYVSSGGTSIGTIVTTFATQTISSGGTASGAIISGAQSLYGTAINDVVAAGAAVYDYGVLVYTEVSGTTRTDSGVSNYGAIVQSGAGTLALIPDPYNEYGVSYGSAVIRGGTLELTSATAVGTGIIDFATVSGTLQIDGTVGPANTISGFVPGDAIDLAGLGYTTGGSVTVTGDTVLVTEGGTSETLTIAGATSFLLAPDAGTGTELSAPCYCPGTAILTPLGEVPVESLAIGDPVITRHGRSEPIKWIGRRFYDGRFIAGNHLMLPITIRAGALADGVPHTDLMVSPGHALWLDCQLVPAWRLVNGVTIIQAAAVEQVTYVHIELHQHGLLHANGALAESFWDETGFRGQFHNAAEFHARYPDSLATLPLQARLEDGFALQRIQERLAARAGIPVKVEPAGRLRGYLDQAGQERVCGWAQDVDSPEESVALEVLVDGAPVLCILANGYRADLRQAGFGSGCHAFDISLPVAGVVTVRRVTDGAALEMTEATQERQAA